jgi:hypothetical protein
MVKNNNKDHTAYVFNEFCKTPDSAMYLSGFLHSSEMHRLKAQSLMDIYQKVINNPKEGVMLKQLVQQQVILLQTIIGESKVLDELLKGTYDLANMKDKLNA